MTTFSPVPIIHQSVSHSLVAPDSAAPQIRLPVLIAAMRATHSFTYLLALSAVSAL